MVRGVLISQGIFQRVFKLATIKVEVVGYLENSNNNKGVIGIFIPLCKLNEVDEILKRIIPTHIPVKQERKSKAFFPFITWNTFISFVTAALCAILATGISLAFNSTIALIASTSAIGGMFVIYEIIMIISSAIAYHSQDISFEEKTITLYNGSLIKCATVIKKEDIIKTFDVSDYKSTTSKVQIIRSSGTLEEGENWSELPCFEFNNGSFNYTLKGNSITTFVIK